MDPSFVHGYFVHGYLEVHLAHHGRNHLFRHLLRELSNPLRQRHDCHCCHRAGRRKHRFHYLAALHPGYRGRLLARETRVSVWWY